jgi:hypothetical protein
MGGVRQETGKDTGKERGEGGTKMEIEIRRKEELMEG